MTSQEQKLDLIYRIFSPSAPIESPELFVGRYKELEKIKDSVEERGQHAVMHGTRGAGKTSLANVVCSLYNPEYVWTIKVTAHHNDNFKTLWEKTIEKIKISIPQRNIGFKNIETEKIVSIDFPDKDNISPSDIEKILSTFENYLLIIFDEFDSIEDKETKTQMADLLKIFSDNLPQITILIIGVAENVNELIGKHSSLERCIKQIEMPLMSKDECIALIFNSLKILEMDMESEVAKKIVEYSCGYPHYVHLLCKYSAKDAVSKNQKMISLKNFDIAVRESIENSDQSIKTSYHTAISSYAKTKNQFEDVIMACLLSETDEKDSFSPYEILENFNHLTKKSLKVDSIHYNLGMLCKKERGEILQKISQTALRYRFKNPLMKAFIRLKFHEISNIPK